MDGICERSNTMKDFLYHTRVFLLGYLLCFIAGILIIIAESMLLYLLAVIPLLFVVIPFIITRKAETLYFERYAIHCFKPKNKDKPYIYIIIPNDHEKWSEYSRSSLTIAAYKLLLGLAPFWDKAFGSVYRILIMDFRNRTNHIKTVEIQIDEYSPTMFKGIEEAKQFWREKISSPI